MLEIRDVSKRFGGTVALDAVSVSLPGRAIVGLVGPNGSGKTTLLNIISGALAPDGGSIAYKGRNITGLRADRISRLGLVRTFQISRPFAQMTVVDNVLAASHHGINARTRRRAEELVELVGLARVAWHRAAELSFGQQRLVELARMLMLDPDTVLLDEPAAGVNPTLIEHLKDLILRLHDAGKSFLIVEHNVRLVSELCSRLIVLHNGEKIADAPLVEVLGDTRVKAAYLGTGQAIRSPHRTEPRAGGAA